ncbi:MAG: hypothetical protein J0I20_11830 [Chloroflexi bacterium]|nr:hypothetical protein [Chloroflexota bacterium]OJV92421.1 MAG: hypothetical protein BGO39_31345 [Chloroflexi bacterium 54-19]
MPKNEPPRRGPSQEERRRRSANRPIGGGGSPQQQQLNSRKKDDGYSNPRLQRISGIIGIIMLVALLLSLVPACYYSQAGAAELPAIYGHAPASAHLSQVSDHSTPNLPAETPLALTAPTTRTAPTNPQPGLSGNVFSYWLEHGGTTLLNLSSQGSK